MSRLLDHLKNAERKRRNLREPPSGTADAAASPPARARVLGAKKNAAKANTAEDERYWAEVRRRLAEVEQQRRVKDTFSPDEERALAQAAGAKALLV